MCSIHEVPLEGCTPEPLMGYLKALGVLRLIAEQKDRDAKGCWRNGVFVVKSILDEGALTLFFAQDYQPTSVFAPWNGDGGFLTESGTSLETVNRLRVSAHARVQSLRQIINKIDQVPVLRQFKEARETEKALTKKKQQQKKSFSGSDVDALRFASQTVKKIKQNILSQVRATFPDEVVRWLDACLSISSDEFAAAPVLGSGGCDGRLEFSANFLSNVLGFLDLQPESRQQWVERAVLARGEAKLSPAPIGQFSPGQVGGPNATQGFEGGSFINPLDFLLMIEGVILFAGSVSRKLGNASAAKAAFPFTVFSSSVGYTMDAAKDSKGARGEIWLPLWPRFAGLAEIAQVLAEGRAEIKGKQASSGVQFARAAVSLGVDRGISSFVRYGFLQRNGKAYLATALGHFDVRTRPDVDLLRDADAWLDQFRRAASGDKAPPRFTSALRRLESAIFAFCQFGGSVRFGEILCAFGNAERELARGGKFREDVRPISGLSSDWLCAADDKSIEFELARALAGIYDPSKKIDPIRSNVEPVSLENQRTAWKKSSLCHVWNSASLPTNLMSVLERRITDADKFGCEYLPLASPYPASIQAVSAYIEGNVDDGRLEELLWGMITLDYSRPPKKQPFVPRVEEDRSEAESSASTPRPYALLKLLFLPHPLMAGDAEIKIHPEPSIITLLRAKRTAAACAIAARRLRASGLIPMAHGKGQKTFGDMDWQGGGIDSIRLGAALLFRVSDRSINELMQLVLRPDNTNSPF